VTIHKLERTQVVPIPIHAAFDFFSDPRNLQRLTPDTVHFQFLKAPPEKVSPGTVLEYRLRLWGVPVKWRTRIEIVEAPTRFIDVQDKGPYAMWRHTHSFRELDANRTEIRDAVDFAMPLGPLGEIAYRLMVAGSLRQIFDYRADALRQLFPEMKTVS
jgi:ligand-binding SRPBCC domain-containing protein